MHTRNWKELGIVCDALRQQAYHSYASALRIPLNVPGAPGIWLRALRFRKMYRSNLNMRCAERLVRPRSNDEAARILAYAHRILRPPVFLYVALVGSHAGFALFLLGVRNAQRDAAQTLLSEFT